MGIEVVQEAVRTEAEQKAKKILAEASNEAKEIAKEAETKIQSMEALRDKEVEVITEAMNRQQKSTTALSIKKQQLEAKKELMDEIKKIVCEKVSSMRSQKKAKIIKKLMEKAKKEIKIGTIYCNAKDKGIFRNYKTVESDLLGGFIAETKDKSVRVDYSFESILEDVMDENIQNIYAKLFE